MTDIRGFFGEHRWLSNFWIAPMLINGKEYLSVEHYYQSKKATNARDAEYVRLAESPAMAKSRGKEIELRPKWNSIRLPVMVVGSSFKYEQHADLKQKLVDTGSAYLEETNTWGDTFWGVCNGNGHNMLGYTLMDMRETFRMESFYE